jgi:hypothetical protein
MQTVLILIGLAVVYAVYSGVTGLRHNIAVAKSTGLPYIVARTNTSPYLPKNMTTSLTHSDSLFADQPPMANNTQVVAPHHQGFPRVLVGRMARVCPVLQQLEQELTCDTTHQPHHSQLHISHPS